MAVFGVTQVCLLVFGLLSCVLLLDAKNVVPVFMWESSSGEKSLLHSVPALSLMPSHDFQNLLTTKLHEKDIVVVFVEENLSIEDFSFHGALGETSFPHLETLSSMSDSITYLPKVRSPLQGIRSMGKKWKHLPFTSDNWDHEVSHANNSLLLISLNDAQENENRDHFLKRHDTFISDVYKQLMAKYNKVAAIYTGRHASWFDEESFPTHERRKRDIDFGGALNSSTFYNGDNMIYLFTHSIPILNNISLGTPTSVIPELPSTPNDDDVIGRLIVTYETATLTFNFREMPARYWVLDEVVAEFDGKITKMNSSSIQAPYGFSYSCRQQIVFNSTGKLPDGTSDNQYLLFAGMQVELFFTEITGDEIRRFNDAYDCTSFFTIGILSGYFVIIIFAMILGMGICMIMDIKTMDRFDDPKGATITISAVE